MCCDGKNSKAGTLSPHRNATETPGVCVCVTQISNRGYTFANSYRIYCICSSNTHTRLAASPQGDKTLNHCTLNLEEKKQSTGAGNYVHSMKEKEAGLAPGSVRALIYQVKLSPKAASRPLTVFME